MSLADPPNMPLKRALPTPQMMMKMMSLRSILLIFNKPLVFDAESNFFVFFDASVFFENRFSSSFIGSFEFYETFAGVFEKISSDHVNFVFFFEVCVNLIGDENRDVLFSGDLREECELGAEFSVDAMDVFGHA